MKLTKAQWKEAKKWIAENHEAHRPTFDPEFARPLEAVRPLFTHDQLSSEPFLTGSGVLVRLESEYFLFTAAHVMESFNKRAIVTASEDELFGLVGESF